MKNKAINLMINFIFLMAGIAISAQEVVPAVLSLAAPQANTFIIDVKGAHISSREQLIKQFIKDSESIPQASVKIHDAALGVMKAQKLA